MIGTILPGVRRRRANIPGLRSRNVRLSDHPPGMTPNTRKQEWVSWYPTHAAMKPRHEWSTLFYCLTIFKARCFDCASAPRGLWGQSGWRAASGRVFLPTKSISPVVTCARNRNSPSAVFFVMPRKKPPLSASYIGALTSPIATDALTVR